MTADRGVAMSGRSSSFALLVLISVVINVNSFSNSNVQAFGRVSESCVTRVHSSGMQKRIYAASGTTEEYRDPLTKFFGQFISKEKIENKVSSINWKIAKRKKIPLKSLAKSLEVELTKKEWFVNGNVDPSYFSDEFCFQDPDVKIKGIEEYAKGVSKIFSQKNSRAEIIAVRKNEDSPDMLTVTWRLSGSVNLGPGVQIKPFIVFTDFVVNPIDGLIVFQEDRFSLPGRDIVLSAFFPFLIEKFLLPPAQPVEILRSDFLEKEKELNNESNKNKSFFEKLNIFNKE